MDLSPPWLNMTESVSMMSVLTPPFLDGDIELRFIEAFLKVLRDDKSESLMDGAGDGAAGMPFCSRRRCRAA